MGTKIVKLNTRIENQRERIVTLERYMVTVNAGIENLRFDLRSAKEKIEWQKKRIANRDEKIKELTK